MRKHDPWEEWMGKLKCPIVKTDFLDFGMAPLVKAMNIPGKMYTLSSCLHEKVICFCVEDEEWFLQEVVRRIVALNDVYYRFNVLKLYDGYGDEEIYRQRDHRRLRYYWVIKATWGGKWKFLKLLMEVFCG